MKLLCKVVAVASVSMLSLTAAPMSDKEKEDAFFQRYDVDRDNRIIRQEMPGFMRSKFNVYDRNHDGFVTKEELRASTIEGRKRNGPGLNQGNRGGNKRSFQSYDRNADGFITKNEMDKEMRRKLFLYDINNDKRLTRYEFIQMRQGKAQGRTSYGSTNQNRNFSFNHFDRNRDGFITPNEMSNKLKSRYRAYDSDGDGQLNRAEYNNLLARRIVHPVKSTPKQYTRRGTPGTFYYLDLNRDGYITKDEMTSDLKGQFYAYDANGDNKITHSEFRAARQDQYQQNRMGGGYGHNSDSGGNLNQDYGEKFEQKDEYDKILGPDKSSDLY